MLEIGSLVDGKYKILRIVGKGGMSVVYQAVNEKANKIWAIKEVRKDGVQNFEVVKQNLIVETEMLKRLDHPNLPSIIDVIDGEGCFLIVMDYIEGNSLSSALRTSGAQNQDDVIEWSKQLCDVLGYLHSRTPPIIYRDMKPSNVMLKPDGNVCLIDFGTAREFKSSSVEDTTCLGTQGYAAPEQYGGHGQTDARTDIYCLGATMYHLLTGHNPSKPPYEMYPIRQWNPMLSSGLEEIITKCTQRNPNDRYQSCAELLYALEHYQDLDIENRKSQKIKWRVFLTSAILSVVMLLAAIGFKVGANLVKSNEYDTLVKQAQTEIDADLASQGFKNAIETDNQQTTAYQELLKLYWKDGVLDSEEFKDFKLLMDKNGDAIRKKDPDGYASICKDFGDRILFSGESEDKNIKSIDPLYSATWYDIAAENFTDEDERHSAELFGYFAKTYQIIGTMNLVENSNDYKPEEFYTNTAELLSEENFDSLTVQVRAQCCLKLATVLDTNSVKLKSDISEEKFKDLVSLLDQAIRRVTDSAEYQQSKDKNQKVLEEPIEEARRIVDRLMKESGIADEENETSAETQKGTGES